MRIFILENSVRRLQTFEDWRPPDIRIVSAKSAMQAAGVLSRDKGSVYSGIMLDYDLDPIAGQLQSGREVVDAMLRHIDRDTPVFVHSMNPSGSAEMTKVLEANGYSVEVCPFGKLTEKRWHEWLSEIRLDLES